MKRFTLVKLAFSVFLIWTAGFSLRAQEFSYMQQLSVDEGLPHTDVSSILQDTDGYVWIGTYSGLCRYDGNVLQCYDMSNSILQSSRIRALLLLGDLLYVGTENGGVTVYDTRQDRFIRNIKVPGNCVNYLFPAFDGGSVWVCANDALMEVTREGDAYSTASFSLRGHPQAGCAVGPDEILTNVAGMLGIFSKQEGFRKIKDDLFVNSFLSIGEDKIIITASQGTFIYDVNSQELKGLNSFNSRNAIATESGIIVGTEHHGVLRYDIKGVLTEKITPWNASSQNSDIELSTVFMDDAGVIWLGTNGSGCFRSTQTNRAFRLCQPFLDGGGQIVTMYVDSKDRLWVSSRDGRLSVYQGERGREVNVRSLAALGSMPVSAIYEDASGNIFLGAWNKGVYVIGSGELSKVCRGDGFHMRPLAGLPRSLSVYKFETDSFGRLWVTTDSGVYRTKTSSIYGGWDSLRYSVKDKGTISDDFTTDILIDGKTVWVGTRASLNKISLTDDGSVGGVERIYVRSKDSAGEFVSFIHKSREGDLWVSILGLGLAKMTASADGQYEFRIYNKSTCLAFVNNEFESLLEDESGDFWIGGFGITKFSPATSQARVYTRKDGLQSNSFKIWDSAKFSDGRMAFGGINGFNVFYPADIKNNQTPPVVRLTAFGINSESSAGTWEKKPVRHSGAIKLSHSSNNITFAFSSMSYIIPQANRYKYQLKGWDDAWHYTDGSNPVASYLNLRPGHYTFVVYGSNSDGVWSLEPAEVNIRIMPAWYQSAAAKIFYAFVFASLVAAVAVFLKKRSEKRHRQEMEEKLKEEQRERNEKELKFHTDFMHEIRTPLTLISTPVEELLNNPNLGKGTASRLHLVEKSVKILQKHIESVTDLRKYDNGQVRLHVVEVDYSRFVQEICLLFQPLAKSRGCEFNLDIPELPRKLYLDKDSMEKVILNLLSNAFKYSPQRGGKIDIVLKDTQEGASLSVSNLGIGILPEDLPYVFDRFRQGRNNDRGGMGIGLAISKASVLSHSGRIWVASVPGGETTFHVLLPYGCAHFRSEDIDRDYENSDHISNYDPLSEFLPAGVEGSKSGAEREHMVLVVDDNAGLREYLSQLLSAKYNVITAQDGESGYDKAVSEQPDLVLTDVVMPKSNGLELCRRIKENSMTSHIPVVLLSARDLPVYKMEGYQMMADDYITKPFHAELLFSRIDNLMAQRECMKKSFREEVEIEPSAVTATPMDAKFIQSLIEDIEVHMGELSYGVDELCLNVGYSRPQLYRKVKSITGMTAIQFLRSIRLKRAAQLLSSGSGASVSQVMNAVGFNNISYFSKIFYAEFGVLPKDYKGKH